MFAIELGGTLSISATWALVWKLEPCLFGLANVEAGSVAWLNQNTQ